MDKLIDGLKELGFNTYEAKVYLALLKKYPATGYEVSKLADIPQSRTYDTLKTLTNKQIVTASTDKPVIYSPIRPAELTKRFKRKITNNIEYLEKYLPDVKENYIEPVLSVHGENRIQAKLIEIVKSAKKEIYLELWAQDFKQIEKDLLNAYNRNVEIRIVGYDRLQSSFGLVYEHPFAKKLEKHFNGRVIVAAADDSEGLFGKIHSNSTDMINCIWTKNKDIVFLIKELVIHDLFILDIQRNLPEELVYVYGTGLKRLYDKILGANNIYRS
ncbi:MAG: hypothetical protein LUB59_03215 [Candidatus Gastranaerophilales bacterium]|nr:hypothetical protein [Candidatus Gastranaerophilales bacterium]